MNFYDQVYAYLQTIPAGKVCTYKDVAVAIGHPNHSRQVGYALHHNPKFQVIPCHRVVNFEGKLAKSFVFGGIDIQRQLLESEGVKVVDNAVDLSIYRYTPTPKL